ncbi:AAA family ATPase [uncultured Microbacterium sp.]|uniref:TrwC relaxase domain-containing protein n=1 Tax=uncultured Microbacterium sp. TaxID=191216 RepID=A0A1Y5NUY3_9MICO|nr:AAA family ATPase [uncultured Microbacterium sp.]SBS70204.1 hypothetical protein MIPYR_10345 [uncultured Microbacterium sp.]
MRGGLERWKRGVESRGVRNAIAYALEGTCDSRLPLTTGINALERYSEAPGSTVSRFIVTDGVITSDQLTAPALRVWITGHDPITGEERGRQRLSPDADLLLDGTINHPKSYSIAALLHSDLAQEFEALQDRLRDQILLTWQAELNARRGHGGLIREDLTRIEVVELQHRRSRALDPHIHRHLWLNVKVRGRDGKWSNIDSRVAMKLNTVINAEGELAARTDRAWVAALARHGFTIDEAGEIRQLAAAVRPLSRRSAQIDANRARLIAKWAAEHGGAPSAEGLAQIDRRAWAVSRPNKPAELDEDAWEHAVRTELSAIDPTLLERRPPVSLTPTVLADLDMELLAQMAVVDADRRSVSSGGRFSLFDLRAGAVRALARSGIVGERHGFDSPIDMITDRARALTVALVQGDVAGHVKGRMASATMREKIRLGGMLEALAHPGRSLLPAELMDLMRDRREVAALDRSQIAASAAIAGSHGLVTVTGPAGTGKTTMLRLAQRALAARGRQMLVVAPTRKAASVAAREIGSRATSVHALLADHGYRWRTDAVGAQIWSRLAVGEIDRATGRVHSGPSQFPLRPGDRVVVDEAGMVDLQTANALADLALEQRVGVAMVGDPCQASPVGHAGAMASAIRYATAAIELDTVHRFRDPDYAALTLRIRDVRDREGALRAAADLVAFGHVHRVDHHDAAREAMIDGYFAWRAHGSRVAVVTGTNAEADVINHLIQLRRIEAGQLDPSTAAWGMGEQWILVGDTVQTRRNDRATGVENRATWNVVSITGDALILAAVGSSGELRQVSTKYAAEHVQLAYASTVHGIQGDTTDASIVGPDIGAAGLYVGLTRGRHHNTVITVARTDQRALEYIADAMLRGGTEITMQDAVRAAESELRRAARFAASGTSTAPTGGAAVVGRGRSTTSTGVSPA